MQPYINIVLQNARQDSPLICQPIEPFVYRQVQTETSDKGGGKVGQFLILADKGGGGVWTPPFLADIVCEQPLTVTVVIVRVVIVTVVTVVTVTYLSKNNLTHSTTEAMFRRAAFCDSCNVFLKFLAA